MTIETLTGQAALDDLARETAPCPEKGCINGKVLIVGPDSRNHEDECWTCRGSGRRLRFPRLSRPCHNCNGRGTAWYGEGQPTHWECGGFGVLPLPLDTAAVGPLLDTLHDNGWSAESNPGQLTVYRDDSPDYRIFTEPELYDRLLAALAWADAQRKG